MKRLLLVAYQFPPVGGAGVQRAVKLVKYLPEFGWECSVLTVETPSVPVYDQSLLTEIPDTTRIITARTLEPGYAAKQKVAADTGPGSRSSWKQALRGMIRGTANLVLQPDPQVLWLPHAVRTAKRFLGETPHDAILATAPPFSSFLLARKLSRAFRLPLVIDYRDEWSICNSHWENRSRSAISEFVQMRQQHAVLRQADAVIATTRHSAAALGHVARAARSQADVHAIYNGFDPADFASSLEREPGDRFRLAYIGTLWNLTDVEPLVRGVQQLCVMAPELADRLEIVFAGRRTPAQDAVVGQLEGLPCHLVRHDYLAHADALRLLRTSDGLCVLLSNVEAAARVVPAKVFECMASRNWILAITPRGELSTIVSEWPQASVHSPADISGICESLATRVEMHRCGIAPAPTLHSLDQYDRRCQAQHVARILNRVAGDDRPGDSSLPEDSLVEASHSS